MDRNVCIKRVFLTGYMGSGKTFVGKALADKLSWSFLDLDEIISKAESKPISEIFKENGEQFFRKLEYQEVVKMMALQNLNIIALGGGAYVQDDINELIQNDDESIVIYLKFNSEVLAERLTKEKYKRPLIAQASDLPKFIEEHLKDRTAYYEKADLIIVNESDLHQIMNQINNYLNFVNQKLSTI